MAWQLAVMAGFSAFGAATGGMGASAQNRALRKQAVNQQKANNESLRRAMVAYYDREAEAARQFQSGLGAANNALAGRSGHSVNKVVTSMVVDAAEDSFARQLELEWAEENTRVANRNARKGAASQMQSPLLAAISGGVSGLGMGASIVTAFAQVDGIRNQSRMTEMQIEKVELDTEIARRTLPILQGTTESINSQINLHNTQADYYGAMGDFWRAETLSMQQQAPDWNLLAPGFNPWRSN